MGGLLGGGTKAILMRTHFPITFIDLVSHPLLNLDRYHSKLLKFEITRRQFAISSFFH